MESQERWSGEKWGEAGGLARVVQVPPAGHVAGVLLHGTPPARGCLALDDASLEPEMLLLLLFRLTRAHHNVPRGAVPWGFWLF